MKRFFYCIGPSLGRYYFFIMMAFLLALSLSATAFAVDDMWTVANRIIVDVYEHIAGISTVLAVIGAKMSNNQHKVDQAWDWLRRIWVAWAVINGIGAFLSYVLPLFQGLATLDPGVTPTP